MARGESGERGGYDEEREGVLGEEAALKILGMVVARIAEVTRDEDAAAAANITAYKKVHSTCRSLRKDTLSNTSETLI